VPKVACNPSFKYSTIKGAQVAKEVGIRNSYVMPTWSGM